MIGAKSTAGMENYLEMSTTNSSSTVLRDVFPLPLTHNLWTSKMVLSRPSNSHTISSTLPIRNNGLLYTPGFLNMSNSSVLETKAHPQQQDHPVEEYSLLTESSVCVRYPANAFPIYHNLPQKVERTAPLLTGQASVHESLNQKPPENIWDMLVGLLGTEQSSNYAKNARNIFTFYLDEECNIAKVDACVSSHQASHSQEQLGNWRTLKPICNNCGGDCSSAGTTETVTPFWTLSTTRGIEEGPTLAAGFSLLTQHLCQRLDCLLHSVTCEMPHQETSQECFKKHCSIMKTSLVHMSSCSEFTSCSNVLCLLFSPLLSHWKGCCGPCSICGPINMKYNKKKILSKICPDIVTCDGKLINVPFQEYEKIDDWRIRAIPYYLREYMMADKSSHSTVGNGYKVQQYLSKKAEGIGCFSSVLTWNQLPGIDFDLNKLAKK